MLDKETKGKLDSIIATRKPVVIISHINPDGDAIGSTLALALFFDRQNVPVTVIIPNEAPEFLRWLPGFQLVKVYLTNKSDCAKKVNEAAFICMLDFNEEDRMAGLQKAVFESSAWKLLIDHHQNPNQFADKILSESWRGSTGEMIYLLIQDLGKEKMIDKDIATCLYVAIITDTGNFRYASSYAEIFTIAGRLIEKGINKDEIFSQVYDSFSENRMKLMGYCMSEKMIILQDLHTAYISITDEELKRFNYQVGDTEGFVNIPFSIKGIKVTGLFVEKPEITKVSLRSKGTFSVDKIATKYFKGGGHINAAGGEVKLSLNETARLFEKVISKHKDEIT